MMSSERWTGEKGRYYVSTGGCQPDRGVGTIALLPEIMTLVDGRAAIAIDGGFYRGNDIVKAIVGADAVGIGSPSLVTCSWWCSRT